MSPTNLSNLAIKKLAAEVKQKFNLSKVPPKDRVKQLFETLRGRILHDEADPSSYVKITPSFWYVSPKTLWTMHGGRTPLYALSCAFFIMHSRSGKLSGQSKLVCLENEPYEQQRMCWEAKVFASAFILDDEKIVELTLTGRNDAEIAHYFDLNLRYYDAFSSINASALA
jgi:hypothetical protein